MVTLTGSTEDSGSKAEGAGELAHALAGPLGGILALAGRLQQQSLPADARALVQGVLDAARRMGVDIGDAIDAAAPELALNPEPVLLRDLIEGVEAHWRAHESVGAPTLILSCNAPADLKVLLDPVRMRRLLNSLIHSALTACSGPVVDLQIGVKLQPGGLVSVHGRLAAPSETDFDDAASLELCRRIARQMDGDVLRARSEGLGVETTFALTLSIVSDAALHADDGAAQEGPLPPRTHLLIVDDNATNRIVAVALCEMFGCTAETANDGVEALEAVSARPFDLILMDIRMPRMDGMEATRAIRALPAAAARTPIVALTANADADAVATYLACGMQGVVDKPIKPEQLLGTLQAVLYAEDAAASDRSAAA
jgi:CheY-like chemotaxis protein